MQEFIKCLRAYLKNEKLNKIDDDKDLVNLCLEQSLQTVLYPVYNDKSYKKYYIGWVVKQEEFFKLQEEITNIFNLNNIRHIYFKGSVLAKIYDDPAVRTRGDIDVYVSSEDLDKAKKVLIDGGFIFEPGDSMHDIHFMKNGIEIELHFNMIESDADREWIKLLANPFELADNVDKSLYEFKPTYHFIYCLMHFANHLRFGAGFRYLLDFYYMFEKTAIDFELLHKHINECNLIRLYSNVINALRTVFDKDYDSSITIEEVDFFIDYLKKYGVHGNSHNESTMNASKRKHKFRLIISRIFLTEKNYRLMRFPKMGKHLYLYPIMIIIHWPYLLTHKMKSFIGLVFGKNKNKDLYKKLGI